jgi:hypothetical protein
MFLSQNVGDRPLVEAESTVILMTLKSLKKQTKFKMKAKLIAFYVIEASGDAKK